MNRKHVTLLCLLFLGISLACALSQEKPVQSGTQIILEADVPAGQPVTDEEMNTARTIIENRIHGLGIQDATVTRLGERKIEVHLPNNNDPEQVIATIYPTALLEFVDMSSISQPEAMAMKDAGTIIVTDLYTTEVVSPTQKVWHTVMTGAGLQNAVVVVGSGFYSVSFELTSAGAKTFADFTAQHIGKVLAIVVDKKIISAPTINDAIPDGRGVISGNFTRDSANQLAIQLRYGALPIPLKIVETRTISPDK